MPSDKDNVARQFESHRPALLGHCYRMLGSAAEADDAVQETMVRAWRSFDGFEGRGSMRSWLYRIATRVCLDQVGSRQRRVLPMELGPYKELPASGQFEPPFDTLSEHTFVEPIGDADVLPRDANPHERVVLKQSIRLAFVTALQHLPPKQRAALLMSEVLGMPAAEVAESLETTVAAVNSALQRARATLEELKPLDAPVVVSDEQWRLVDRYVHAFERYDVDALSSLLHQDVQMSMPPFAMWFQGAASIAAWMLGPGAGCRGSKLLPTEASGLPAFGQYRPSAAPGVLEPWALIVLEPNGDLLQRVTYFLDTKRLFPQLGLPELLRV